MTEKPKYTLYYWPVPFRGHFIRAILSYAKADWAEGEGVAAFMYKDPENQPIPFMGPPVLINNDKDFAVSQMSAIAFYLGEELGLLPESHEGRALALKIVNDANDLIDELTIQGGREMWDDKKWADFQPRLKLWLGFFEDELYRSKTAFLVNTDQPTIADIVTTTLFETISERFPKLKSLYHEIAPNTAKMTGQLWQNELADFAKQSWETYGEAYCGGQIGDSLRKVVNGEK